MGKPVIGDVVVLPFPQQICTLENVVPLSVDLSIDAREFLEQGGFLRGACFCDREAEGGELLF